MSCLLGFRTQLCICTCCRMCSSLVLAQPAGDSEELFDSLYLFRSIRITLSLGLLRTLRLYIRDLQIKLCQNIFCCSSFLQESWMSLKEYWRAKFEDLGCLSTSRISQLHILQLSEYCFYQLQQFFLHLFFYQKL